jgi:predicted nucleic acid-binding protein
VITFRKNVAAVDSGPLIALYDKRDRHHARVVGYLRQHPQLALVTTWPVLTEACAMLFKHVHQQAALDLLKWIETGAVAVINPGPGAVGRIHERMARYHDLPLDFADAALAELLDQERIETVLSIDTDFDVYRGASRRRFHNPLSR